MQFSLTLLLATIVTGLLSYLFANLINKRAVIFYAASIAMAIYIWLFATNYFLTKGGLAFAFFTVIMFIGILSKKTNFAKVMYGVREELSIMGSVLLIPHSIKFLPFFYKIDFFRNEYSIIFYTVGMLAFLIIIPLFITSFKNIRKKMQVRSWKKLHKLSYLVYITMYLHFIVVSLYRDTQNYIVYSLILAIYIILKLRKYFLVKKYK